MMAQPQIGNHYPVPMNFPSPFPTQMPNPYSMMHHMGQMNPMNQMNQMGRVPPMMPQMPYNYFMDNQWMYYFMNQGFPNLNCQYQAPVIDLEAENP